MKLSFVLYCIRLLLFVQTTFAQQTPQWGIWQTWGDKGDGTYQNPSLPAITATLIVFVWERIII